MRSVDVLRLLRLATLLAMSALVLTPVIASFLGGFKTVDELRAAPLSLPEEWLTEYYGDILRDPRFWGYLGTSLYISVATMALTVISASMAAFVFAHIRFFGSTFLLTYLIGGFMFPVAAAIIPLFLQVRDIGLLDSAWGVILPQAAFGLGFSLLLLKAFFDEMPKELFEAARLDGCGYVRFFLNFTLPLSSPILVTVATFVFVSSWNDYLLPLVVLNSPDAFTWTLGIMQFSGEYIVEWNRILAFVSLNVVPAIGFFLVTQRYFVAGLSGGAPKG